MEHGLSCDCGIGELWQGEGSGKKQDILVVSDVAKSVCVRAHFASVHF